MGAASLLKRHPAPRRANLQIVAKSVRGYFDLNKLAKIPTPKTPKITHKLACAEISNP